MIASTVIAIPFLLFGSFFGWVDPAGDTFGPEDPPLDLVALNTSLQANSVVVTLQFDPNSTSESDLSQAWAYVDFDSDFNANTGRVSHLEEFDNEPFPQMGVDYFVTIYGTNTAVLTQVVDGMETDIDNLPVVQQGLSLSVTLSRCEESPENGICISEPYRVIGLIGNSTDFTFSDRIPNGSVALAHRPGDFDNDGDVDDADVGHMRACQSGADVPFINGCGDADLDHDGDVDQDDFGILQRNYTGS